MRHHLKVKVSLTLLRSVLFETCWNLISGLNLYFKNYFHELFSRNNYQYDDLSSIITIIEDYNVDFTTTV